MTVTTIILIICALVITLGFILLVAYLLPVLLKLRDLMSEAQSTAVEIRQLAVSLQKTSSHINDDLERVDDLIVSSRETMDVVTKAARQVKGIMNKNTYGLLALLPAIRLGWKLVKKIKGGR